MKYGFGVDVGGTTIKLGLFEETGSLVEKWEIPTKSTPDGGRILPDIAAAIDGCLVRRRIDRGQILGIGLGVPGPVDAKGVLNRGANVNWGVFNLHEALGALTGLPVKAGNDANVAALGECWQGGGKGFSSMVLVTLGTGIGGGIVLNGKVLHGAHGAGGEIGHMTLNREETEACGCGKFGCAEQYGSATGIVRLARRAMARSGRPSPLRSSQRLTCKEIFDWGARQDPLALEILEALSLIHI